jgi:syntaxin-binding protein 1
LKTILTEVVTGQLSLEDYPSVLPMPDVAPRQSAAGVKSARAGAGAASVRKSGAASSVRKSAGPSNRWSKSSGSDATRSTGPTSYSGGRTIVFMMGGLSYSELRVCREVMMKESSEIVCGSTALVSANDFIDDLALLGQDDE